MFNMVEAECVKGHNWQFPMPNYWIGVRSACPECEGDIMVMRSAPSVSLSELQQGLKDDVRRNSD